MDDSHLLDNGSALLVQQLALTQAATVLATVRAGEVLPDPVLSLWKDGPAERIEIGVLDDEAIEELLALVLREPVDAAAVRELAGRSRGNPMFFRELVSGALETGALVGTGGCGVLRAHCPPLSDWPSWWRCAWATSTSPSGPSRGRGFAPPGGPLESGGSTALASGKTPVAASAFARVRRLLLFLSAIVT